MTEHEINTLKANGFAFGSVALVNGGADGIGLASACQFASLGMTVCLLDKAGDKLTEAAAQVTAAGAPEVATYVADVSDVSALQQIELGIAERFGGVDVLMNNAGIQPGSNMFGTHERWQQILGVNLWGVINGTQVFTPRMIERGRPGAIINTGSKQGITTPPGDPAYNVTKAGVKAFTEALAYELRNTTGAQLTAHLLIPGFVYTGLTKRDRTEKPAGAWTPEQTAEFLMSSLAKGDFYILCPDNDVDRAMDEKRMAWAIGDIIENRPPLSRWHPDYADAFTASLKE